MTSILDHRFISQRYFFPRADPPRRPCIVRTRDGCELACAHYPADGERTVVHFHGNGEVVADWEPLLPALFNDVGVALVLVEYRGYGSSGGEPLLATMLDDGEDVLRELDLDPAHVFAFGRSIGSLYAVELAQRAALAGLILDSGIHDLTERLLLRVSPDELGVSREAFLTEVDARFDHKTKLAACSGPALLLHARDDDLVDITHAERNAAAHPNATLVAFDHGGHNALYFENRTTYDNAIRDLITQS